MARRHGEWKALLVHFSGTAGIGAPHHDRGISADPVGSHPLQHHSPSCAAQSDAAEERGPKSVRGRRVGESEDACGCFAHDDDDDDIYVNAEE